MFVELYNIIHEKFYVHNIFIILSQQILGGDLLLFPI